MRRRTGPAADGHFEMVDLEIRSQGSYRVAIGRFADDAAQSLNQRDRQATRRAQAGAGRNLRAEAETQAAAQAEVANRGAG